MGDSSGRKLSVRVCRMKRCTGFSKRVEEGVVRAGGSSPSIMYCRLASQCV